MPITGAGPIQAWIRPSSPFRNRWQRTPPVARPLAGYSAKGVTFTLAPPVPGSAPDRPVGGPQRDPARCPRAVVGALRRQRRQGQYLLARLQRHELGEPRPADDG